MERKSNRVARAHWVLLATSVALVTRAPAAKSGATWQDGWAVGVSGAKASCVEHSVVRGKQCSSDSSLQVRMKNVCAEPIRVHFCIEKTDGALDCGLVGNMAPAETNTGAWTCHATDRWRAVACSPDENCKASGTPALVTKTGVNISSCVEQALSPVATQFFERTAKPVVVTDGVRSPEEQASQMHRKLQAGEDIVGQYEERALATEIAVAWASVAVSERSTRGPLAIAQVIRRQLGAGSYVSRHLRKSAADVRTEGLSEQELAQLRGLFDRNNIRVVDERRAAGGPHLHLNVTQCD